jgi:hypothetical protein
VHVPDGRLRRQSSCGEDLFLLFRLGPRGPPSALVPLFSAGAEKRAIALFSRRENQDAPKTPPRELWVNNSRKVLRL